MSVSRKASRKYTLSVAVCRWQFGDGKYMLILKYPTIKTVSIFKIKQNIINGNPDMAHIYSYINIRR